ncbi:MAG: carboxypeptidase regulatory-like domain-containing protein [Terracidiphilus sp.]|nr:carboxypeptidase regulatory-like domain-containing protein [Terracidiphilus sp.]
MNQTFRRIVARFTLLTLTALLFTLPGLAQQTLGSLNGTVEDPSGASVPGAKVTATNAAINVTATATTSSTGYFQIFNLPIGTYEVRVSREGFEVTRLEKIPVQEARATTVNATLKVGQVTDSVTVTATPLLNATDATNGYTLDAAQIEITPLATGSFTQMAVLSPGVNAELLSNLDSNAGLGNQPIWANGQRDTSNTFQVNGVDSTNLFNGKSSSGSSSQRYNFNIGSAPTAGGSFSVGTSVYGSNGNSLPSPPPEFIQEERVNASMYDAQQGATSGAQIDVNTQTGTNNWHASVYGSYANNLLNASPFYFNQSYQLAQQGVGVFPQSMVNPWLRRWDAGITAGGPVKTNKLFFFVGYQRRMNEDSGTGLSEATVPFGLTDDRSLNGLLSADASWGGYLTSTSQIDGVAATLLQTKLANGQYLIPSSQAAAGASYQYGVPNVYLLGVSRLTSDQADTALDYDATKNDRVSAKYFFQNAPVTRPFGFSETAGFPITQHNGAQVFSLDNTIAIGQRLNWEQRLGFVRMGSFSNYVQNVAGGNLGVGAAQTTGMDAGVLPGLAISNFGYYDQYSPSLNIGPAGVPGAFVNMGYYQNRLNPSTNVIFTAGKHTIVAGGGYSYTQLNITNNRTGHAQAKVSGFDNFLQGFVHSSLAFESIDDSAHRNNADRYYRTNELSGYVQDKWQVQSNLSITGGVRYDYHGGMTEKYGDMFNFDPALYDVTGTSTTSFNVVNSGFVVGGNNAQHPTKGVSASTLNGRQWGISPRLGFAWSPTRFHNNLVISGGGGLYYDRGELMSYLSQPAGGSIGGPFGVTESAPLASVALGLSDQGTRANSGGLTLENPMGDLAFSPPPPNGNGAYVAPSSDPGAMVQVLQQQLNQMTGSPAMGTKYAPYGKNCSGWQSQEGYTLCTQAIPFGYYDKSNVLPYTINYTLNVQWQPANTVAIMVGYTGNRGRHSVIPIPFNEPGIATSSNPIWGETSSYGMEVMDQNSENCDYDYCPIPEEPWATADSGNTDFRTPYVGYSPNSAAFKTVGVSAYDALEAHVEKRLSHNFQVGGSYTWSHSLDEQSDIGLFFTGDNPNHLRDSWASSDFDRTHVFSANFQVDVPNAAREHTAMAYVTNDWHMAGTGILQSGEPYSLYEFYGAVGSINFGNYPTLMNPVLGIKDPKHPKNALTGNKGSARGPGGSYIPSLDPSQIAIQYLQPGTNGIPVSANGEPKDEYETAFNVGQRNIFRQSAQKRLDLSFRKGFRISEKVKAQFELNIFNVSNTTSLDVPQDQAQIRQNNGCSAVAINAYGGGTNCNQYRSYLGYGQIVTSNDPADQQSALGNLDQVPFTTGTGKQTQLPLTLLGPNAVGGPQGTCTITPLTIAGTNNCPNNAADFGSATGTIGGARAFVMGFHITY